MLFSSSLRGINTHIICGNIRVNRLTRSGTRKFCIKKLSIRETADATGYSPSLICTISVTAKENSVSSGVVKLQLYYKRDMIFQAFSK
uniref:Uncharacterized protein n=2 Tax=Enterobacteriaceae TaxID=543 RepID=A0A3G1NHG6_CITFR|nr:Hypothetical protein [Citrobacter freundii]AVE20198.1 Resolvase domain protein [Klebsiella pneumoniae]